MRLLIIGSLGGQIGEASQIAASRGALVSQANDVEAGLNSLRSGQGADLIMIDCKLDISPLVSSLKKERISVPVVACGVENDSRAAVNAIKAGAQEYVFESGRATSSARPSMSAAREVRVCKPRLEPESLDSRRPF